MADKRIQDLTPASSVGTADRFVLEQSGQAKSLTGQVLVNDLATYLDGHGGIASITYTAPVSPSLNGTLTITLADESVVTLSVTNGRGITSISSSSSGLTDTYTLHYNDGTTSTFDVTNGRGITGISKSSSGLTDTYTLSYNDGTTSTFSVDNGKEISSVLKTGAVGLTDIYTISYNDNTTDSFNVTNGRGIDSISWSESGTQGDGMTHTGTISYNDNTTSTIIFHDGVKGDTGAQTYVWFKWAQNYPTQDSDMQNSVAPYIGIYSGLSSTAPTDYTAYAWYQYKGDKGDTGDTGDYIDPVVSFGTSTAAATEPQTWYSSPSSISYAAGNFIWQKTQYTLHNAQTVQSTEKKIIGYIGQNGSGSGTVTQITFNGTAFQDDGTGNVPMTVDAADVGAIADPANKANGQVLTYDSSADEWVASTPTTGDVNTVNNVGVTAGTTNIQLYGTAIPMSSTDNTSVKDAIPLASSSTPQPLGTAAVGTGTTWARADHVHQLPTLTEFGGIRPNLLKNWYFVGGGSQQGWGYFPINSKGQTSYSTRGQTIDRWDNFISDVTTTVQSDSIKISDVSGHNEWIAFAQDYIAPTTLKGKTVTLSALCGAITGDGFNFIIRLVNGSTNVATYSVACVANSLVSFTRQIAEATFDRLIVAVQHRTGAAATSTIELKAVKLELGDSQTLAHQVNGSWVLNELPQFDDEYARSTGLVYSIPRPNLLDNWYFVGGGSQRGVGSLPINSKGQTSYSSLSGTACIDRWAGYNNLGVTLVTGGANITGAASSPFPALIQFTKLTTEEIRSKTLTLSFLLSTGIVIATGAIPNTPSTYTNYLYTADSTQHCTIQFYLNSSGQWAVQVSSNQSSGIALLAAKLELGDTQTLAHQVNGAWVLNEMPNYEVEFYKSGAVDTEYVLDTAYCSKVGKACVLTFDSSSTITTGNVDAWKALVTLPSKYRPAVRTYGVVGGGGYNSTYYCTVRIETTGVVSVSCHQAANVAYLAGQITYFTAQ